jgi:hypothetical protein
MRQILKNKKYRIAGLAILLVSMISFGIFMQSCNSESDNLSTSSTVDSQESIEIVFSYSEIIDNQYVLNNTACSGGGTVSVSFIDQ